jgi:pimeloyl-ACP methyl ester carboxylesterase
VLPSSDFYIAYFDETCQYSSQTHNPLPFGTALSLHRPAPDFQMQARLVQSESATIEIFTLGEGPLLVMLPSLGRGVEDMAEVAQRIARQGFSVCLPNPRGIGQSAGRMHNISLDDLADDVMRVIHALTAQPVVIAGHAFGNWVARNLATRFPSHIRGVVLLAAAHNTIRPELTRHINTCMDMGLSDDIRLDSLQYAFFAPGHDAQAWLSGWHPEVARMQREASQACPRHRWWHAGSAPILDLQAEQDPFAPSATAHDLAKELGTERVQVLRIQHASHALIPEQPAAVTEAIIQFMLDLHDSVTDKK